MATIICKRNKFNVVYSYYDEAGKRHQKWEAFSTMPEAKQRKSEIEYKQQLGSFTIPTCNTLNELLKEYVSLYGKTKWAINGYSSNTGLIRHYIAPKLGELRLKEITPRVLEMFYQGLLKTPAVPLMTDKKYRQTGKFVQPPTIRKIHNLLHSAFNQAEKWELIEKNPAKFATLPKYEMQERDIWDSQTLFHAIDCCEDERLKLCLNLAFSCSLRIGELLGLTWDCVDISEESIAAGKAHIVVNKQLQRVNKRSMEATDSKDVLTTFPEIGLQNNTVLILKKPKTRASIRKIFLPKTVAENLTKWKMEQDLLIEQLGAEYHDYNLVIAGSRGQPVESNIIRKSMRQLIEANELPQVCFHSLRHSSITYKLKLNGGDIKAVQGDSGHAQATMVTDQYSHILDESRRNNAQLFAQAFYGGKGVKIVPEAQDKAVEEQAQQAGLNSEVLLKIFSNPDMVAMLKMLAKTLG
ncbi:MAG: tyrosine-type recombinase/integrase [Christensenellales bacterium]